MAEFKKGDRVRDRYKQPKLGDACTDGTVISATDDTVLVRWDVADFLGRQERSINPACLVKIEEEQR